MTGTNRRPVEMTIAALARPHLMAALNHPIDADLLRVALITSPYTPVGHTPAGTPVYPAQGGRSGGGIDFIVGDDEGPDPQFGDRDEDDDEDDEPDDEEPAARRRSDRRTTRRDQDDDDPDDDATDWTPPTRDDWERAKTALRRANREAGSRRRVGKAMERLGIEDLDTWLTERGIDPATGQPYGADVVSPDDETGFDEYEREPDPRDDERASRHRDRDIVRQVRTAEQRGRQAERGNLMPVLAQYAAEAALHKAGFNGTEAQMERMLYSIRPGSLELDMDGDDFELIGLEEEIEKLRDDFPERFGANTSARRRRARTDDDDERDDDRRPARRDTRESGGRASRGAREVDGGDRGRQPRRPLTWLDRAAEQMNRRGR